MKKKNIFVCFILMCCLSFGKLFGQASTQGQWSSPVTLPTESIHVGVFHTGDVIYYPFRTVESPGVLVSPPAYIFNPNSPTQGLTRPTNNMDLFCAGMTMLEDGRYLMTGGTQDETYGRKDTWAYNPTTHQWEILADSIKARWYPSVIMLGNGKLFNLGGLSPTVICENSAEIYDPATNTWTNLNNGNDIPGFQQEEWTVYPRLHLLPDNPGAGIFRILQSGTFPDTKIWEVNTNTNTITLGPVQPGQWVNQAEVDPNPCAGNENQTVRIRYYNMSVRLQDGRFMVIDGVHGMVPPGGGERETILNFKGTDILDLSQPNPQWVSGPVKPGTKTQYQDAIILPDGHVFVVGGGGGEAIYNPNTNSWSTVDSMLVNREYHSGVGLLPDGRVIISGGTFAVPAGPGQGGESSQIEIYSPPYLFNGNRPVISSAPTTASYGQNLNVPYTSTGGSITRAIIHRPGDYTHCFNYNMISEPVNFVDNGSSLTVTVPSNPNVIPPGYYLLFLLSNNGGVEVPSVGHWINISGSAPPVDTNPPSQPSIASFTAVTENSITVNSTVSTDPEGSNPVQYQFDETSGNPGSTDSGWQNSTAYTDSGLSGSTQYCYRVRSRDSAGTPNVTGYSSTSCQTTNAAPDTDPPTPNPMTFASAPSAIGDAVITMTATTASDPSPVIEYQFDETTGNPGGTDSGWQISTLYYDLELNAGTQYSYRVRARDGLGNIGSYSSVSSISTAPEDGFVDVSVGPGLTFNPANITINVGDTVEWTFIDGGHNVWAGQSGAHNFFNTNPTQILFASSADPTTTNPAGFVYSATFDQSFLDNSTGDGSSANIYNYHCHIHTTTLMSGQITINGGVDTAAPTPNPMTFASVPAATSSSSIDMTATTAVDGQSSPVEYFFTELTGNPGGSNSTWQSGTSYTDTGLTPLTLYSYTVAARDSLGNTTTASAAANATTPDVPSSNILLETGVVNGVGSSWTTVNLGSSYNSMVVVATPNYTNTSAPGTVRIQNASGNSFQVRLDGSSTAPAASDIYYMVVEEGVYTVGTDGVKMEAVKYNSTVTSNNNSWVGEARSYANSYTSPVVLGQVMSYNDAGHVEFWSRGSSRQNPPSSSALQVGKTVNEDPDNAHANETIGYIVLDSGNGAIDGVNYAAGVTSDGVAGVTNAPPYGRPVSGLSGTASIGVACLTAMDGGNGGWGVFYGSNPISNTNINLAIDEDQLNDTERSHTGEQVAYIVFEDQAGGDTTPPTPNPATFSSAPSASSSSVINMTATTASDPSGPVEYNFDNTSGSPGGTDSGWQTSTSYSDTGLSASTQYCYTVQSRDSVGNTGAASSASCATTQAGADTTPPTPNPATFASSPAATSSTVIAMTATTGSDPSGPVEYFFTETSGNPGGSNSTWQTSTSYSDGGLTPSTQYCYTVTMRDSAGNVGSSSSASCATTQAAPDTTPPTPNPATFATAPNATGQASINMVATAASDPSSPVEYQFNETTGGPGATDSGWQTSTTYNDTGLTASTQYCYQVRSRDSVGNTGSYSSALCATTDAPPGGSWTKVDGNAASYIGTWETVTAYPAAYQGTTQWGLSGSFTYNFTGTGVRIHTWDCDGGTINLTIDGQSVGSITTTGNCSTSVLKYENTSLSSGSHTLVGTISSGEVEIDAFEAFN